MNLSTWLLYLAVTLIQVLSPGPAIILAVSNGMTLGLHKAVFSSLGNITGLLLLSIAAMIGLGAILKTSATLFTILKIVGAAYLFYLGLRQWRSKTNIFKQSTGPAVKHPNNGKIFTRGFFVAITNPKPILFFTALFPQFVDPEYALLPQFFILTGTFMFLSFCSLTAYAFLARSAKRWFSSEHHAIWFNRATGGAFMLLAIGMLGFSQNQS